LHISEIALFVKGWTQCVFKVCAKSLDHDVLWSGYGRGVTEVICGSAAGTHLFPGPLT